METADEDLACAAGLGDRDAFALLLERHYDMIFGLILRLTGHRYVAEDLAQDICIGLAGKLSGFEKRARFRTWLYRVVVNAVHDWRRRETSRAKASAGWGDWEIARQAEMSDAEASKAWLAETMSQLPEDLRDTVALILGEEMTQAAAAEVLGISEGTVAWRMSEVKRRLRAVAVAEDLA
ncbi:RNA polymerase sigma factor [Aestuariibius insulae]|uniref:RNA polymerase sigma factor n=1 Tax=Aestuariibius insulae TaxID=2058287 RepID=UPI00345E91A8